MLPQMLPSLSEYKTETVRGKQVPLEIDSLLDDFHANENLSGDEKLKNLLLNACQDIFGYKVESFIK